MLTSVQNPLIKHMRKLHQAKYRRSQQQFLLEGSHLIQEACAVGYPLEVVCYTAAWQEKQPSCLWSQLQAQTQRLELVTPEIVQAIASTINPDGVVAMAPSLPRPFPKIAHLGLVLETIQDPGNLGTMIRTAAAAGADGLLLSADSVDLENSKVLRASAGNWFRLPMAVLEDPLQDLRQYQQQGMQLVATVPQAPLTYWELDLRQPTLFLMGNEGAGLSQELIDLADQQVQIPLAAGVESLNVAIAAALLLYEAQRQQARLR